MDAGLHDGLTFYESLEFKPLRHTEKKEFRMKGGTAKTIKKDESDNLSVCFSGSDDFDDAVSITSIEDIIHSNNDSYDDHADNGISGVSGVFRTMPRNFFQNFLSKKDFQAIVQKKIFVHECYFYWKT